MIFLTYVFIYLFTHLYRSSINFYYLFIEWSSFLIDDTFSISDWLVLNGGMISE